MDSKYGVIDNQQLSNNYEDIAKQIFSCLIKKEESDTNLSFFITCLIHRIHGLNSIVGSQPELITVMSLLEDAKIEHNFRIYRKFILDACSIMYRLKNDMEII